MDGCDAVFGGVEDDEMQAERDGDGVSGLGFEIPLQHVASETEGDFGAIGDKFLKAC